jgi:hypothetical protein
MSKDEASQDEIRKRDVHVTFRLSDKEKILLEDKIRSSGIHNKGAYIRKMVLDGYIVQIDFTDLKKFNWLLSNATKNINQVAKKANETGYINTAHIKKLQEDYEKIRASAKSVLEKLAKI